MKKLVLLIVITVMAFGCTKVYNELPTSPTAVANDTGTVKVADKIEFRVIGQDLFGNTSIQHTDPINGVTIYSGGLPYFAAVESKDESIFLFIQANASGNFSTSNLHVQIFVNGKLFREAFATGFSLSAQASGTFRH